MTIETLQPKQNDTSWTHFWDMHSGGSAKTEYEHIFVELPEAEAIEWFKDRFDQDPNDVACRCCGENFSIHTAKSLEQLTGYHRNCDYENGQYVERSRYSSTPLLDLTSFCERLEILVVKKGES